MDSESTPPGAASEHSARSESDAGAECAPAPVPPRPALVGVQLTNSSERGRASSEALEVLSSQFFSGASAPPPAAGLPSPPR